MKVERHYPSFDDYMVLWNAITHPLLGWSSARTEEWAKQFETDFSRTDSEFHREGPIMAVSYEFIPQTLKHPDCVRMRSDVLWTVEHIITDAVRGVPFVRLGQVNWEPVQKQIDVVLRRHGSSLEEVRAEKG